MSEPAAPDPRSARKPALPIAAPTRKAQPPRPEGVPDLHIEEIEERHIPKDRNIFDK